MPLTTAGAAAIAGLIMGSGNGLSSSTSYVGVGNGTTAFSLSQTDLVGASKLRKLVDAGFPTASGNNITFKVTFGPSEANFAWAEFGIFNAASSGVLFTRKAENMGIKVSGQTWVLEVVQAVNIT